MAETDAHLSEKEEKAIAFIRAASPSFRDLQRHMGWRSPRSAEKMAEKLRSRGLLTPSGPLRLATEEPSSLENEIRCLREVMERRERRELMEEYDRLTKAWRTTGGDR